jgi:tetratricopeptide (TPR) repeat protein
MKPLLSIVIGLLLPGSLLAHGDLHNQITQITRQLESEPRNAVLYHKRGELHRAHGEYPEALADYEAAEKLDPKLDVVFLSRGRVLSEFRDFAAALKALDSFLIRHPDHIEARWLRGRVLARLNRRDDAEKEFAGAIAATEEPSPEQIIERSLNLEQAGRADAALSSVNAAMQRVGSLATLEMEALNLEVQLKRYDDAVTRLDRLMAGAQRKETYLARKAAVLRQAGKSEMAQRCYAEALEAIVALPENQRRLKSTIKLEEEVRRQLASR